MGRGGGRSDALSGLGESYEQLTLPKEKDYCGMGAATLNQRQELINVLLQLGKKKW